MQQKAVRVAATIDDDLDRGALEVTGRGVDKADLFREDVAVFVRAQPAKRLAATGGAASGMELVPRRRPGARPER